MAAAVCNVNDVLDGHVTLDLECLDRVVRHEAPSSRVGVKGPRRWPVAAARWSWGQPCDVRSRGVSDHSG